MPHPYKHPGKKDSLGLEPCVECGVDLWSHWMPHEDASAGKRHPDWPTGAHAAHEVVLNSGITGGDFFPQEVVFTMQDGSTLEFYPDAPPEYRGGSWRFHIDNNRETHYISGDAVLSMTTKRQTKENGGA